MDKLSERLTNEMKSKEQQSRVRIKIKKRNYKKRKPRRKMNCHAALYMTESNSCRVHGLRTHAWGGGAYAVSGLFGIITCSKNWPWIIEQKWVNAEKNCDVSIKKIMKKM